VGASDLFAKLEKVPDDSRDRPGHLPGTMDGLARFAREVAHDDLGYPPAGDPAPGEALVAYEIDAVLDLDASGDIAPEGPAAAVDVVQRRSEDPAGEEVQSLGENQPWKRVVPLLLPAEDDVSSRVDRLQEHGRVGHRVLTVAVHDHDDFSRRVAQRRFRRDRITL